VRSGGSMILDPEAIRFGDLWLWPSAFKRTGRDPLRASFMPEKPSGSFQMAFHFDRHWIRPRVTNKKSRRGQI
jgi:hypothetical protein